MYEQTVGYPKISASETPFPHLFLRELFSRDWAGQVRETCENLASSLDRKIANRPDKQYSMKILPLYESGLPSGDLPKLPPVLRELAQAILASALMDIAKRYAGLSTDYTFDLGLYLFEPGDFVSPHLDKQEKALTAVIYLNENWDPEQGGSFDYHGGDGEIVQRKYPEYGSAILFQPGPTSLHSVAEVKGGLRITLQLEVFES